MKQEVYSCMKMLESLRENAINLHNIGQYSEASEFAKEYVRVYNLLEKYLTKEQKEFIPILKSTYSISLLDQKSLIIQLTTCCDIAVSYLKSLEMDLDKELEIKKKELQLKENEISHMHKLFTKSLEAIKQFPELQRSKIVEETKKSHRQIEANSRK